ncbi:MAG: UDP-N-acetylmuramoyl-L-alanine--D-glutamate ligase [Bacteroidales bacterium]|nr:UDP-N-acetylmuramoyl-L-alanine--D-glutamate ligase [Bacteroidales bacterium]
MKEFLNSRIEGKQVVILGLGAEGRSTYKLLRRLFPEQIFTLVDRREELANDKELKHAATKFQLGPAYLANLGSFDLIIKSPGISLSQLPANVPSQKLTSQTAFFLEVFRDRTIGITGTKGKSTTASLIFHLLTAAGKDTLLIGNIGVPPFDVLDRIKDDTLIVFELSSHQLEAVKVSPHISVLLNIYQEHLDHYASYQAYQMAKYNIARWQKPGEFFIYHYNDLEIPALIHEIMPVSNLLPYALHEELGVHTFISEGEVYAKKSIVPEKICNLNGKTFLNGDHNQLNLLAALSACHTAGVESKYFCSALDTFKGLQHRMEFVGEFGGIKFYNDSIATIPEAVIYALETIGDVDTLILGGFDRGIDYSKLTTYLGKISSKNIFLTGNAGKRLKSELESGFPGQHNYQWFDDFDEMISAAITSTAKGRSCLLSPAAASYDRFMNFEHRGKRFREIIKTHFTKLENL